MKGKAFMRIVFISSLITPNNINMKVNKEF